MNNNTIKIGMGYDVHRLVEGRDCKIGGLKFDHAKGPLGHSDGDVLLHAICDAFLGALALGDIGDHFPPTDEKFKDMDSKQMLKECYQKILDKGFVLNNLDTVIVCEEPKIKPRRLEIRELLAKLLSTELDNVSVKATTEEKMGLTGTGDAIAAWAYVSLVK